MKSMRNEISNKENIIRMLSQGKPQKEITKKLHVSDLAVQEAKNEILLRIGAAERLKDVKDFEKRYGLKKTHGSYGLLAILTLATLIIFWSIMMVDKEITINLVALSILYILVSIYVFLEIWKNK
jgi:hypothetical protein